VKTPAPTEEGAARPPGRPRSPQAHRAILDAALDLFVEQGYATMSNGGHRLRAGVGKTTIYRRWPSKEDLIVDAIDELIFDVEPPDTGSLREDLAKTLVAVQTTFTSSRAGQVFPRMAGQVAASSLLGRAYLRRVIEPRFALLKGMIARGVERGELPADVDPELVRGLLIGPIILWKLTGRLTRNGARDRAERIVETVLKGLRNSG
jgi:AcrR family transcriptional regulator